MSATQDLFHTFEESWKQFSTAWKKARSSASEPSIHDLRVGVRRLVATLGLAQMLSRHQEIPVLQKRFKKVLKNLGRLRDVQVQLQNVCQLRQTEAIQNFTLSLRRCEEREITKIENKLKSAQKSKLSTRVKAILDMLKRIDQSYTEDELRRRLQRGLTARQNDFWKCHRRFDPANIETLHDMRIALKKLRYSVEAAQYLLGPSAKQHATKMQNLQRLMGDTRDLCLLRAELDRWASKRGKKLAVVPALDYLDERQIELLKEIAGSARNLENIVPEKPLRPNHEKTAIVASGHGVAKGIVQGQTSLAPASPSA